MRCLFGKKDDLHEYAERMARGYEQLAPLARQRYGSLTSFLLHRDGLFQTELVTAPAHTNIPAHRHPGVDSIECPVRGFIRLVVDGIDPYQGVNDERLRRFALGKLVRIDAQAWHGGRAGPDGVTFLSMQRWDRPQEFLGEAWEGQRLAA